MPFAATPPASNFEAIVVAAAALLKPTSESPSRGEVLARYRRLREISIMHRSRATAVLSADAILRVEPPGTGPLRPPQRTRVDAGP